MLDNEQWQSALNVLRSSRSPRHKIELEAMLRKDRAERQAELEQARAATQRKVAAERELYTELSVKYGRALEDIGEFGQELEQARTALTELQTAAKGFLDSVCPVAEARNCETCPDVAACQALDKAVMRCKIAATKAQEVKHVGDD